MLKNWLKKLFDLLERPLPYFFTFHLRPKRASQVGTWPDKLKTMPKCAIVIQGPILYREDFTLETIKLYKKKFPEVLLILSTWDYERKDYLEKIKNEGIEIVLNHPPSDKGYANINYQIVSALSGVKLAEEKNALYVLKTRTDQRIYNPSSLEFLLNIIEKFPIAGGYKQMARIVGVSLNTFKFRRYGISDMNIFGYISDLMVYWNPPLWDSSAGISQFNSSFKMAETYLSTEFLEAVGKHVDWTLEDSWRAFADHFCVVDQHSLNIYWHKYSRMKEFKYLNYSCLKNDMEMSFAEWFNIYANLGNKQVNEDKIIKVIP